MASFNKVMLMGNFVRDPELRMTPGGLAICKFTVASSRTAKQSDGSTKEETTFVDIEAFGKQAEVIAKYFQKGRPIFLEGRLRLNEWQTKEGEKRSKLLVILENFVFMNSGKSSGDAGTVDREGHKPSNMSYEKVSSAHENNEDTSTYNGHDDEEDVPF